MTKNRSNNANNSGNTFGMRSISNTAASGSATELDLKPINTNQQQQYEFDTNSIDEEYYEFDPSTQQAQCGSFYLRVGAVAFGVGSMIYSGLEFGQFFELESKEHCYSFIYGFTPSSHMIFTFIQLYFIFMNSRVLIARHKLIGKFSSTETILFFSLSNQKEITLFLLLLMLKKIIIYII